MLPHIRLYGLGPFPALFLHIEYGHDHLHGMISFSEYSPSHLSHAPLYRASLHILVPAALGLHYAAYYHLLLLFYQRCQLLTLFLMVAMEHSGELRIDRERIAAAAGISEKGSGYGSLSDG